jgi:hypothetical protein
MVERFTMILCKVRSWTLVFFSLSCVTASAAFVAVEFSGRVSGSDALFGYRRGALVKGYFAYDPQGPQRQVANQAIFMFEIPENHARFDHTSYDFLVFDNWAMGSEPPRDGLMLSFYVNYPRPGYGTYSLMSSNTALLAYSQLPQSIPPLSHFDGMNTLYVTVDSVQPYQTLRIEITHLSPVPELSPSVFDLRRRGGALNFRFLTQPSTRYAVEVSGDLTGMNWVTLTNVAPTSEPIAIINDAEPGLDRRFYRVRKQAN